MVAPIAEIVSISRENGWQGVPTDVVTMSDGRLTALDNAKVVAAWQAVIQLLEQQPKRVVQYNMVKIK